MGRKAYMEIGKPLPNRVNYVLTRDPNFKADGCIVCQSLDSAFEHAEKNGEKNCFVIGGATVYKEALPFLDGLYLTEVKAEVDGDVKMPDYKDMFRLSMVLANHQADDKNDHDVEYQYWTRR
jgi:dihydrofolate reductase